MEISMNQNATKKELLKNAEDYFTRAKTKSTWSKITTFAFLVFIAASPTAGIASFSAQSGSLAEQALLATSALSAFGAGGSIITSRVLKKLANLDKEKAKSLQMKANEINIENEVNAAENS